MPGMPPGAPPAAAAAPNAPSYFDVDCALEALPRTGNVVGRLLDSESMTPISGATVKLVDTQGKELQLTSDSGGAFRFEGLSPGTVTVKADATDYMLHVQSTDVRAREERLVRDVQADHRDGDPSREDHGGRLGIDEGVELRRRRDVPLGDRAAHPDDALGTDTPLEPAPHGSHWIWWVLGAAVIVAGGTGLALALRAKKDPQPSLGVFR